MQFRPNYSVPAGKELRNSSPEMRIGALVVAQQAGRGERQSPIIPIGAVDFLAATHPKAPPVAPAEHSLPPRADLSKPIELGVSSDSC
jgi:hypothetical protein